MRSFRSNGGSLGRNNGFEEAGAYSKLIGEIEDIKTAPSSERKRLVVKEKGKSYSRAVIDIDVREGRDVEKKETYVFQIKDKESNRYGRQDRKPSFGMNAYDCDVKPEEYSSSSEHADKFSRFGGSGRLQDGKRTKF